MLRVEGLLQLPRKVFLSLFLLYCLGLPATAGAARISGRVADPQGSPVSGASVKLISAAALVIAETRSDQQGTFIFDAIPPGQYQLSAQDPHFVSVNLDVSVAAAEAKAVTLQFLQIVSVLQSVTVVASSPTILNPDPSRTVVIHDQVLDANPGRPGAPISIPGLPIETASGGIKAPQYFAPGVAGDHGEPIAQYFQIGDFLFPNNLPANAHGNGYADPNFLIPPIIEAVNVNGGAFNVRQGNNSVDLAASYVPRRASIASSSSPETIAISISWQAGVLKSCYAMPGLGWKFRLAMDFSTGWNIGSSTS